MGRRITANVVESAQNSKLKVESAPSRVNDEFVGLASFGSLSQVWYKHGISIGGVRNVKGTAPIKHALGACLMTLRFLTRICHAAVLQLVTVWCCQCCLSHTIQTLRQMATLKAASSSMAFDSDSAQSERCHCPSQ